MKNLYIKNILLFCSLIIGSLSCTSLMQVERQEDFSLKSLKVKQIVSINPSFKILSQKEGKKKSSSNYSEAIKKERSFNKMLVNNAKKNEITLQIIDTDELQTSDAAFFNNLAPLRKEILQVNYLQDFKEINKEPEKSNKSLIDYEKGPKISTHYSHLAEVYGTPFFAVQGISFQTKMNEKQSETILSSTKALLPSTTVGQKTIYFTLIADVSKSQIVYREYREVDVDASDANLNSIIYDSFKIISN